jgi:CelD/BcsL family acetyltransferase involved in cellulose biosynthesis
MVWPLVLERAAGLGVLRWMGMPVSQYGDVLVDDVPDRADLLQRGWQFICANIRADALHLRKVRADSAIAPLLAEVRARSVASSAAPYLDLAGAPNFAAYEQRYSAKVRKNRRRLVRRLHERGSLSVERHNGGPTAAAAARDAIALKQGWLDDKGRISPAISDARFAAFFADVAEGRTHAAGCAVTILKSDGEAVGYAIDVTYGGRRAAHLIVHDQRFDAYSAGMLLLQEWIRGASADSVATFDLLAPAYAYKWDWADDAVPVADYAIGLNSRGRLYADIYLRFVRRRLKALAESGAALRTRLRQFRPAASFGARSPVA